MSNPRSDKALLRQIEELSSQIVNDCYQCGCCTSGCPIGEDMNPPPSKAIRLLQLGRTEELLASEGIWMCASCLVCGTRCPRAVDYARIAEACRALVLRNPGLPRNPPIPDSGAPASRAGARGKSRVDPDTVEDADLEEIPQQAFIASFRKFSV